jgi:hypothetical protein
MKSAATLSTILACCVALAVPTSSGAWEPAGAGNELMSASGELLTLQVPLHYNGSIYLGEMYVNCPEAEVSFRYWRGEANLVTNGSIGPDDGYCYPELANSSVFDNCVIGGVTTALGIVGNGDPANDEIVLDNGPTFGFQFQGASCPFVSDTFSLFIQDEGACTPSYDDSTGEIEFDEMLCLQTELSTMPHIRDDEAAEIETEVAVYDPVSPFPYMEE